MSHRRRHLTRACGGRAVSPVRSTMAVTNAVIHPAGAHPGQSDRPSTNGRPYSRTAVITVAHPTPSWLAT